MNPTNNPIPRISVHQPQLKVMIKKDMAEELQFETAVDLITLELRFPDSHFYCPSAERNGIAALNASGRHKHCNRVEER
ncbi:hypothetical protein ACTXT7_013617 [Hymenolepis weldensis]